MTDSRSRRHTRKQTQRRLRRLSRTVILLAGATALLLGVGGGTAMAYFFSGSAHATAEAHIGSGGGRLIVLYANGSPSTKLQPGGTADLLLKLKNPEKFPIRIVGISEGTPTEVRVDENTFWNGHDHGNDCTAGNADVSVNTKSKSTTGLTIKVTPGYHFVNVPLGAKMGTNSASGCQGATFHLPITLKVVKV